MYNLQLIRFLSILSVKPFFFIPFQDYTDRDVQVISRGRIDELTDYVNDKYTGNHATKVLRRLSSSYNHVVKIAWFQSAMPSQISLLYQNFRIFPYKKQNSPKEPFKNSIWSRNVIKYGKYSLAKFANLLYFCSTCGNC